MVPLALHSKPSSRNSDLWKRIHAATLELGGERLQVVKVRAHRELQQASSAQDTWEIANNSLVDKAASAANQQRDHSFWEVWDSVRRDRTLQSLRARIVIAMHRAVASAAVRGPPGGDQDLPRDTTDAGPEGAALEELGLIQGEPFREVCHKFGHKAVSTASAWLRMLLHTGRGSRPAWVSFVQLLALFTLDTGIRPPLYHKQSKTWKLEAGYAGLDLADVPGAQRVQNWRKFLVSVVVAAGSPLSVAEVKPLSSTLMLRLPSLKLVINPSALDRADAYLHQKLGGRTLTRHS